MENKFGDYRKQISGDLLNKLDPPKKNKFIAVLKLKYPKAESDIRARKCDIDELLTNHNNIDKVGAYIELLDVKSIYLILGLELPDYYDINNKEKKQVSRYIGNAISKNLYHKFGWNEFTNVKNALFSIVEIKRIDE